MMHRSCFYCFFTSLSPHPPLCLHQYYCSVSGMLANIGVFIKGKLCYALQKNSTPLLLFTAASGYLFGRMVSYTKNAIQICREAFSWSIYRSDFFFLSLFSLFPYQHPNLWSLCHFSCQVSRLFLLLSFPTHPFTLAPQHRLVPPIISLLPLRRARRRSHVTGGRCGSGKGEGRPGVTDDLDKFFCLRHAAGTDWETWLSFSFSLSLFLSLFFSLSLSHAKKK